LSSALLEDREIREAIQEEKLVTVLDFFAQNHLHMYCDIVAWETTSVFGRCKFMLKLFSNYLSNVLLGISLACSNSGKVSNYLSNVLLGISLTWSNSGKVGQLSMNWMHY